MTDETANGERGVASSAQERIPESLRFQAQACRAIGSPLYADLLQRAAADFDSGGPTAELLRGQEDGPGPSALALRLMGAVNRLVLGGDEPALAALYGDPDRDEAAAWREFRSVLERNVDLLHDLVRLPVQTNEIGRCAALLPGFFSVARATGLPLRILEVGASAGLNLAWDLYRYVAPEPLWGPPGSPVSIPCELEGGAPFPDPPQIEIAERRGCDSAPIDPTTPEGRLALLAYVWPDQLDRVERLRAALRIAAEFRTPVENASAAPWTERVLNEPAPGRATVLFHSLVMQYLSEQERAALRQHIELAGARASADAPLAWLRMEPGGDRADVRLSIWPGNEDRRVARAGYHGSPLTLDRQPASAG
jgi:hypothetical protein